MAERCAAYLKPCLPVRWEWRYGRVCGQFEPRVEVVPRFVGRYLDPFCTSAITDRGYQVVGGGRCGDPRKAAVDAPFYVARLRDDVGGVGGAARGTAVGDDGPVERVGASGRLGRPAGVSDTALVVAGRFVGAEVYACRREYEGIGGALEVGRFVRPARKVGRLEVGVEGMRLS